MRRIGLWTGLVTLVLLSCMPAPAEKEGTDQLENLDVVRLEIGPTSVTQLDKMEQPIPQVPIGRYFWLEVSWTDPVPGLQVALSDFQTVSFHHPGRPESQESPGHFWRWNEDDGLMLSVEGDAVSREGIVVELPKEQLEQEGPLVTRTKVRLERRSDTPPFPLKPSLILFRTTVTIDGEVQFTFDPPWVEKPPTG